MTYDRRHLYLQWGGSLPGGEEWVCGVRIAGGITGADPLGFPTHGSIQEALDNGLGDAVEAFHTRAGSHIATMATLQFAKLNAIGLDGHYVDETTISRDYGLTTYGAAGGTATHPNQIALCVSLTTAVSRGYAHRGRFYMPMPYLAVGVTDGLIAVDKATEVAESVKTFMNALADDAISGWGSGYNPCVMSKHGTGATHEVQGVEIGRVLDTQRRRRRSIAEQWVHVDRD